MIKLKTNDSYVNSTLNVRSLEGKLEISIFVKKTSPFPLFIAFFHPRGRFNWKIQGNVPRTVPTTLTSAAHYPPRYHFKRPCCRDQQSCNGRNASPLFSSNRNERASARREGFLWLYRSQRKARGEGNRRREQKH